MTWNRAIWKRIHFWLAVAAVIPLLTTAATGILLAYQPWLEPGHFAVEDSGEPPMPLDAVVQRLLDFSPDVQLNYVSVPSDSRRPYIIYASIPADTDEKQERLTLFLNPYSGDITRRDQLGLVNVVEQLHRNLALGKPGRYWVGASSLALIILSLVGIYLWWPMRRSTLRRLRRVGDTLSWHNAVGVAALPLVLVIAFTGITLTFNAQVMPLVRWLTVSPPLPQAPSLAAVDTPHLSLVDVVNIVQKRHAPAVITAFGNRSTTESAFQLWLRSPGDMHPNGWKRVFIHPTTGETIARIDAYQYSLASAYERSWFAWHTGVMLGTPGRVLWSIVSGAVFITGVTGLLFWWRRRSGRREYLNACHLTKPANPLNTTESQHGTPSSSIH